MGSIGAYWSDEGDNYIDPFYGEDDDASVLNDNNNAPV
jgi:hypothetical protein